MDFRSLHQGFVIMIILLQLQNIFTNAFDYDDDNDSSSRCPWIRNKLKNGRVKIRSRGRIAKFLCDPGFELAGKRFATCVRGQWNNPIPVCVARGCPKLPEPANGRVTEMYRGALLMYDCLPGYVLDGDMSVFCDGRRWNTSLPACVVAKDNPAMSCDFESPDLCGWNHDPTHDFDWQRNQHSTPSGHVGTGPSFDHTYGEGKGGFYLYIEASSPRKVNDTSRLFSPVFPMDYSGGCFSFWYHMYGSTTGGLRVYIRPESSVFDEVSPTWEKFGDQGNQWRMGNFSVPYFDQNFQIVIEGIRGASYIGDTAIDDVNISTTGCESIGNATESSIEVSEDSCRGRCQEQVEISFSDTGCGCDDSCYPDNCCGDYQLICTLGTSSVSDNPEELPAGDLLPTTSILTTMYGTASTFSTMVTVEQNASVVASYDITHSESSGMHFTSEAEAFMPGEMSSTVPTDGLTLSSTVTSYPVFNDSSSRIPTDSSSFIPAGRSSPLPLDGSSSIPSDKLSPLPSASSSSMPSNSTSSIPADSSSFIPTNISSLIPTDSSSTDSLLSVSNFSSTVISTDKSSAVSTDKSSTVITNISTSTRADYSSSKTSTLTQTKSSILITELLTTSEILLTENKRSHDNPTTAFISTTELQKNATNSNLLPTMEPIRNLTTISHSSVVPDIFSNTTVKEATSSVDFSHDFVSTSSSTRRTYNLRPRTRKTTATEWSDATTTSISSPKYKLSTDTNKETESSTSTPPIIIYRYTVRTTNAGDSTTVSSHFTNTDTSSKPPRETIFYTKTSAIPSRPLTNRLITEKYISTTPYIHSTIQTSSYPESIDSSASKSASTSANKDAVVPIVSLIVVIAVAFVGGWIFFIRRKRAKRQSKLSDDSELRYLQANEITDY